MFPRYFQGVSNVFPRCVLHISKVCPRCFQGVSNVFPRCLHCVYNVLPCEAHLVLCVYLDGTRRSKCAQGLSSSLLSVSRSIVQRRSPQLTGPIPVRAFFQEECDRIYLPVLYSIMQRGLAFLLAANIIVQDVRQSTQSPCRVENPSTPTTKAH